MRVGLGSLWPSPNALVDTVTARNVALFHLSPTVTRTHSSLSPPGLDTSVGDVVSMSTEEDDDAHTEVEDEIDEDETDDVSVAHSADHIPAVQDPIAADIKSEPNDDDHVPQPVPDWFLADPADVPTSDTISHVVDARDRPHITCNPDQAEAAPVIKLEVDGSAEDVPDWQADLKAPDSHPRHCWMPRRISMSKTLRHLPQLLVAPPPCSGMIPADRYPSHVIFLMQFAHFITCISHCMAQDEAPNVSVCAHHSIFMPFHDVCLIVRSLSVSSCFVLLLFLSVVYLFSSTLYLHSAQDLVSIVKSVEGNSAAPSHNEEYCPMAIYHPPTIPKVLPEVPPGSHDTRPPARTLVLSFVCQAL